ncbi:MAG: tRNA (adenosine(37)-N6)-threonylcarbamoyltransferase complex dimerization subunit type 1 TsaB [Actinomycetota bacterium]|nr:tRNA (adenosine(37)-N6)-threonylcarbamoyltransferase complex dimerization subunit type 1 TsaB [Actinomycetota bacterium]
MNILGIDTTTHELTVAVNVDSSIQSFSKGINLKKHMVAIMGCIDQALKKAGMDITDIDLYAADIGPGDFTGTRIGLSVAKTLAWARGKPVYGINVLDALALQCFYSNLRAFKKFLLEGKEIVVAVCMDVRRSEIFSGFYNIAADTPMAKLKESRCSEGSLDPIYCSKDLSLNKTLPYRLENHKQLQQVISPLAAGRDKFLYVCGNAPAAYKQLFKQMAGANKNITIDYKTDVPHAGHINLCAFFKHQKGCPQQNLQPYYVRDFIPFGGVK